MLLQIPDEDRCSNDEVVEVTEKYVNVLRVFDAIFSKARTPSFCFSENDAAELKQFVAEGMLLWRALELRVSPKSHCIEDHLCDQMTRLGGIGDLGEDMVEQSHQEGIKYNCRSRTTKSKDAVAQMQCKWEEKRKHPLVQLKKDMVQERSV